MEQERSLSKRQSIPQWAAVHRHAGAGLLQYLAQSAQKDPQSVLILSLIHISLFLLKSSWLTEAFSAVLSALCLFTPFEEFVNSSFSIPTLVYYCLLYTSRCV